MKQNYFALIDCNNFFASCERIFRPDLKNKPIAVLSSNDGCVVARSKETKDIGIPMGAPLFKFKDLVQKFNIQLFSSNFSLYQDISARVMSLLSSYNLPIQIYSVDEAFLDFSQVSDKIKLANKIQQDILQQIGIPVSVGIAKTKTLAKMATEIAKHHQMPVFEITENNADTELQKIKIHDVWGIGKQHSIFLRGFGIDSALKFKQLSNFWIRKKLGINGERIWYEVRGLSCLKLQENHEDLKSMIRSKSFGEKVYDFETLFSAISSHVFELTQDLRSMNLKLKNFRIFIATSRFSDVKYFGSEEIVLDIPTNDTIFLNKQAQIMLQKIFKSNLPYKKAGVSSSYLISESSLPSINLFDQGISDNKNLMQTIDSLNQKFGEKTIQIANSLGHNKWYSKKDLCSPKYTTDWSEILTIKV